MFICGREYKVEEYVGKKDGSKRLNLVLLDDDGKEAVEQFISIPIPESHLSDYQDRKVRGRLVSCRGRVVFAGNGRIQLSQVREFEIIGD